jgi:hypothetical protein
LHSVATHDKMYDLEDKNILEQGTNRPQNLNKKNCRFYK